MKLIRQTLWIIFFTFIGEILNKLLPLPVPAGVYGLILMLIFLMRGLIRLDEVEVAGSFLLETMSIMFLPAAVGIMTVIKLLLPVLLPYTVIIFFSTFLVISVTGLSAEFILRRTESKEDKLKEKLSVEVAMDKKEKQEEELVSLLLEDAKSGLQDLEG